MLATCGTYPLLIDALQEEGRSDGKMWMDGRSKFSGNDAAAGEANEKQF
jgi:hypothetical protein